MRKIKTIEDLKAAVEKDAKSMMRKYCQTAAKEVMNNLQRLVK